MFGFQRIGDLIWAAADMRVKGFLLGGTAGRTTLAGEGLQHQDGHSHVLALTVPTCKAYDPAYAYELAVIVEDGLKRMYRDQEDCFYYLTVMNEQYAMPAMPEGAQGRHPARALQAARRPRPRARSCRRSCSAAARSSARCVKAQQILGEKYGVAADVWSVTSYNELYRDGLDAERWNMLHPAETAEVPYVTEQLGQPAGRLRRRVRLHEDPARRHRPLAAAAAAPARHRRLRPQREPRVAARPLRGRRQASSSSPRSRRSLKEKKIDAKVVQLAMKDLGINPEKKNPAVS